LAIIILFFVQSKRASKLNLKLLYFIIYTLLFMFDNITCVHISGTSGVGKTTLGKKIKELCPNITICETDQFFNNRIRTRLSSIITLKDKIHHWKTIIETHITSVVQEVLQRQGGLSNLQNLQNLQKQGQGVLQNIKPNNSTKSNKVLVFVGLLNNSSPDYSYYDIEKFLKAKFGLSLQKWYYNCSVKEFIKRYYYREVVEGLLNNDKMIAEIISRDWIVKSSVDLLNNYEEDKAYHISNKYKELSESQILNLVKSLIKQT
jgi:ABC-type dipeptide/oligopeptide/nickel transport system ATPase component